MILEVTWIHGFNEPQRFIIVDIADFRGNICSKRNARILGNCGGTF